MLFKWNAIMWDNEATEPALKSVNVFEFGEVDKETQALCYEYFHSWSDERTRRYMSTEEFNKHLSDIFKKEFHDRKSAEPPFHSMEDDIYELWVTSVNDTSEDEGVCIDIWSQLNNNIEHVGRYVRSAYRQLERELTKEAVEEKLLAKLRN